MPESLMFYMHDLSGGGVERMRLKLVRGFADRNTSSTLIVQQDSGEIGVLAASDLRVVVLGAARTLTAIVPLWRATRRLGSKFLVSSLDHNNITALIVRILRGRSIDTFVCQHNALSAERELKLSYRVVPVLYRLLTPWATAVICVSHGVGEDLKKLRAVAANRIKVIYNPVISSPQLPIVRRGAPHQWFAEPHPVIVFVGRLVVQKDPVLLLESFAKARRTRRMRLVILGEGPLLSVLQSRARSLGVAEDIAFPGFVGDIAAWLQHAACLVLTSRYEGFGNVIVEALACGTPVIATDCCYGPAEILDGGRFGVLVACGDALSLSAAMLRNLRQEFTEPDLRARANRFSVASCVAEHQRVFDDAPRRKPRPFGLKISRLTAEEVADRVIRTRAERSELVVTPNIDHIALLDTPEFERAYRAASIVLPDGFPVAIYSWLRGAAPLRRVTGCDLTRHLVRHRDFAHVRVAVLAESAETASAIHRWLHGRFAENHWTVVVAPSAILANAAAQARVVTALRAAAPDIVFVLLGAPTSEIFVERNRAALPPAWFLCVGQALRVELGLAKRAPKGLRFFGLEWAWRLASEPRRLARRYGHAAFRYPAAIARDLTRARSGWTARPEGLGD